MKYLLNILACTALASAWLPHERDMFNDLPSTSEYQLAAGKGRVVKRYSSSYNKIRGANLGSLFIIEPWMASTEWSSMGCSGSESEWDCVAKLGQSAANTAFQKHWDSWITEEDLTNMTNYGLNTIRVPVGHWIVESTVNRASEYFPEGGMSYLDRLVGWAADKNIYVILDLHGAPGAQVANNPFTGKYVSPTAFYNTANYTRAESFLTNITTRIHSNNAYRTVGMLEVLNEPESGHSTLVSTYYAKALSTIRSVEENLSISSSNALTVQFMSESWGAGDPSTIVGSDGSVAYDDHRYLKYDTSITPSHSNYIQKACASTYTSNTIVGEWSVSPATSVESDSTFAYASNKDFYKQFWAAQVQGYETGLGWVYWAWKSQLGNDYRWSYSQAVQQGVFPTDPTQATSLSGCSSYKL